MQKITILGSTGSIGTQTLEVVAAHPRDFEIIGLSANSNIAILTKQIQDWKPKVVAVANEKKADILQKQFPKLKILSGKDSLVLLAKLNENDMIVNAVVGFSGLKPTLEALKMGKKVALANKESLVTGGELITTIIQKYGGEIIPIDSEHSAIFQCLQGNRKKHIEKIILTASGGPFLNKTKKELQSVTKEDALKHPKWNMGKRISIDSATMMNKGFEVIEAMHLFNLPLEKIEVVIHPQSIIHSFVQFSDGNILAQMGPPDMRLPISYALHYPERSNNRFPRLSLHAQNLTFQPLSEKQFPCFALALEAAKKGGTFGTVLNAADEVAVQLFLEGKIRFLDIEKIIKQAIMKHKPIQNPTLEDLERMDQEVRRRE